jgi:hypothetical protein
LVAAALLAVDCFATRLGAASDFASVFFAAVFVAAALLAAELFAVAFFTDVLLAAAFPVAGDRATVLLPAAFLAAAALAAGASSAAGSAAGAGSFLVDLVALFPGGCLLSPTFLLTMPLPSVLSSKPPGMYVLDNAGPHLRQPWLPSEPLS